jgi:hypothetical protein
METHRTPDCAGSWSLVPNRHPTLWECGGCGARVVDEPDVRLRLQVEAAMGVFLDGLTLEGARLLELERHPSPSPRLDPPPSISTP